MDEKELAAELQASKDDPTEWGDADVETGSQTQRARLAAMVSIRLTKEELELVQARAHQRRQSVSAYLRELALRDVTAQARADVLKPFAVVISTAGTYSAQVNSALLVDGSRLTTLNG